MASTNNEQYGCTSGYDYNTLKIANYSVSAIMSTNFNGTQYNQRTMNEEPNTLG